MNLKRTLTEYLRNNGNRITSERYIVLDAVSSISGTFTVNQVYELLKESRERISLATAHNALKLFLDAGLIKISTLKNKSVYYETVKDIILYKEDIQAIPLGDYINNYCEARGINAKDYTLSIRV